MWYHNAFTKKIGVKYPIIQAPMAGVTTPELVAAVSNENALGSLGAGYMTAEQITQHVHAIGELTDKPFLVNVFIPGEYKID